MTFAGSLGLLPKGQSANIGSQLLGGVGRLTSAVGSVIGAVASMIAMLVIGIFLASEPRIYDRGIAWTLPLRARAGFYRIAEHVGFTLRRLLFGRDGNGVRRRLHLVHADRNGGVRMAGLLGLVTGVLAFIPNIGAITSGLLMVAVGFSAGASQGVWCIIVYFLVHNIDAYLVMPFRGPAHGRPGPGGGACLSAAMGALFGLLGVLFADPILATLKVVLVDLSEEHEVEERMREPASLTPSALLLRGLRRLLLLLQLLHLLRLHLLHHHRSAAADNLLHAHLEGEIAPLGSSGGGYLLSQTRAAGVMVKRYSPPSCMWVIASAKPGYRPGISRKKGCAPPWAWLLSRRAPSSVVTT